MGSIKPDESKLHSKKLAELGVNYLDALFQVALKALKMARLQSW